MFSHVMLGADDLEVARTFYDAVLAPLGKSAGRIIDGRLVYAHGGALLMLSKPIDGKPATAANGGTVGFRAASPDAVDAWHAAGIAHGGVSCEDPPGPREGALGPLYLAYLRDPWGNKICAAHRLAAAT